MALEGFFLEIRCWIILQRVNCFADFDSLSLLVSENKVVRGSILHVSKKVNKEQYRILNVFCHTLIFSLSFLLIFFESQLVPPLLERQQYSVQQCLLDGARSETLEEELPSLAWIE